MKKNLVLTAAVCLALGAAIDHIIQAAVSQPAAKPTYDMPNNEVGQGNGDASKARLTNSTRHGVMEKIKVPGQEKEMDAFVVYPEKEGKVPVVLCIMEIFGMTDWVKSTTDQLAADGFIAIAPDFNSLKGANSQVMQIPDGEIMADLNAARDWGLKLPGANGTSASIGFCYGGGKSMNYATVQPALNAAVSFYGTPPADAALEKIKAPVLAFYGSADTRVSPTAQPLADKMKKLDKPFEFKIYPGAGHGFMRQQTGPNNTDANAKAAKDAWPIAIKFIRDHTRMDTTKPAAAN